MVEFFFIIYHVGMPRKKKFYHIKNIPTRKRKNPEVLTIVVTVLARLHVCMYFNPKYEYSL